MKQVLIYLILAMLAVSSSCNYDNTSIEEIETYIEENPENIEEETVTTNLTEVIEFTDLVPAQEVIEAEKIIPAETINPDYVNAYIIWDYLHENGFNNYVASGILGNIMIECGGGYFEIKPEAYGMNDYYYGICQWNKGAYEEVHGKDLDFQLGYLKDTIKAEFDKYAPIFNTSYEEFMALEDEERAALQFARIYERCSEDTYEARQYCARLAYNFFVKD